ncbi:MAG: hypothetical protein DMG13_27375 [Acidobacteria bacterium]|nr:MAG: hypothetical protein DMG13_27375 [Acidobacteriota bacterium]
MVTEKSLHVGRSMDLGRSNGFFIRVRDRLVNETDPLFGLKPLSYQTFNRFRADLFIDDLDRALTAPREGVEESDLRRKLEPLLEALFYEARDRYQQWLDEQEQKEKRKKEHERRYTNARFVEYPTADVLTFGGDEPGAEADNTWFYLTVDPSASPKDIARDLYANPRARYTFRYVNGGRTGRLVEFSPSAGTFSINADHDLVQAYGDDVQPNLLLEDLVASEALLEVYLRESGVSASIVGEVLERRDSLLRSLANEHMYSLNSISQLLLDSSTDQYDLEVALVTAARALGFVATHISGSGEPDGIARLVDYPAGERRITLGAKSSTGTPSLAQLDMAGIQEHMKDEKYQVDGCLLIAPGYPGQTRERNAIANRARTAHISCWTVKQLAAVVASAEIRQISAARILEIVLAAFAPSDVTSAVSELLAQPSWDTRDLYGAVTRALRALENRLRDTSRTVDQISTEVSREQRFADVGYKDVEKAVRELAGSSQGAVTIRGSR